MPAAVLSRRQYEGFRSGHYEGIESTTVVDFDQPWDLRSVKPDPFPVPCCVIFGERAGRPGGLPDEALAFTGRIALRGTRWPDAQENLAEAPERVERGSDERPASVYADRFYQGATVIPRVLLMVRELPAGPLGVPTGTRRVGSLRSSLEKKPWKDIGDLEGLVEEQFLRRCYLGASVAPFRALEPVQTVIPWSNSRLLHGNDPELDEYPHLASWWRTAEELWDRRKAAKNPLALGERLDFHRGLSNQFPIAPHRLAYTASGNRIAACRLGDARAIVEHKLYWAATSSPAEGQYLAAVLNSDAIHEKVEPLMSEGLFGKRDIDKYVFAAPVPIFSPEDELHAMIAALAAQAEELAAEVDLSEAKSFQAARRAIRDALDAGGIAGALEAMVAKLLAPVETIV